MHTKCAQGKIRLRLDWGGPFKIRDTGPTPSPLMLQLDALRETSSSTRILIFLSTHSTSYYCCRNNSSHYTAVTAVRVPGMMSFDTTRLCRSR